MAEEKVIGVSLYGCRGLIVEYQTRAYRWLEIDNVPKLELTLKDHCITIHPGMLGVVIEEPVEQTAIMSAK